MYEDCVYFTVNSLIQQILTTSSVRIRNVVRAQEYKVVVLPLKNLKSSKKKKKTKTNFKNTIK